jgi:Zn-dependent peptidase ImmA (M78 family)/DNA-binding XRE family transcriptional regulator
MLHEGLMDKKELGENIRKIRDSLSMTQAKLGELMGWNSHVTVHKIETGERDLKASELIKLTEILHIDVYKLCASVSGQETESPYFFWRGTPTDLVMASSALLKKADDYAFVERLVDTHREFEKLARIEYDISTVKKTTIERWADDMGRALDLGRYPAESLVKVLESNFGIRIIMDDFLSGGSGATFSSDSYGTCIFLSAKEPTWRQNFSIAHELFHLITWDKALFEKIKSDDKLYTMNESYADHFASCLLMPIETFREEVSQVLEKSNVFSMVNVFSLAHQFRVSAESFIFRMVSAGYLNYPAAHEIIQSNGFKNANHSSNSERVKVVISDRFLRLAHQALVEGKLSRGKVAKYLGINIAELDNYLEALGLPTEVESYELKISNS